MAPGIVSRGLVATLQCVEVCCCVLCCSMLQYVAVCCSVLQCVAVCCNVLQCIAVCCSVLQCVAVSCSVLQSVAECCSVLPATMAPGIVSRGSTTRSSPPAPPSPAQILMKSGILIPEPVACTPKMFISRHSATHCNTLQHTATHCNTLQHTATHCNTLQQKCSLVDLL